MSLEKTPKEKELHRIYMRWLRIDRTIPKIVVQEFKDHCQTIIKSKQHEKTQS